MLGYLGNTTSDGQDEGDDAQTECHDVGDQIREQREESCQHYRQGRVTQDAGDLQVRSRVKHTRYTLTFIRRAFKPMTALPMHAKVNVETKILSNWSLFLVLSTLHEFLVYTANNR